MICRTQHAYEPLDRFRLRIAPYKIAGSAPYLVERYPEPIVNFVQFQFYTGLRTSEAIALDWGNVDFNKGEILVDCALVYEEESDSTTWCRAR